MRLLPYGDTALLVDADGDSDRDLLLALRDAVLAEPGIVDAVPAARTLLIEFDPSRMTFAQAEEAVRRARLRPPSTRAAAVVEIRAHYDGADIGAVAELAGLSRDDVIELHCTPTYTVAFCGFTPGFAYLQGLDPALHVPRLDRPRTLVPAGSVAIAGEFTGVYPRSSPGGWRLLGVTDAPLWDTARQPPALLHPGTRVRFVPQ